MPRPTLALAALALLFLALAGPAAAQNITLSLGDGSLTARTIQLFALITVLSLAPGLAIMITCFPFIVTVLAILRQALGLQQSPPNMLIVSLALFLTYFVMEPVFAQSWAQGIQPLMDGKIDIQAAFTQGMAPFRTFMAGRIDAATFDALRTLRPDLASAATHAGPIKNAPLSLLIPSFLLSEIQRAFEIGFLIYLPFLIIDLVVAAVLMSMGMMMVPPAMVSLPFKLAFFVVVNGWTLVSGALVRSYF
jgi:flagellar biosynthesis protein FliP